MFITMKREASASFSFARTGVAVVHRRDEARAGGERNAVVARHVDYAAEVQCGVEHGERFVLCHVYLVEHAEAALHGALVYRPAARCHLAVLKVSVPMSEAASVLR